MKSQTRIKIDKIDAKILRAFLKEARTTFTEIAKDCKISVGAVRARYTRLKREGVINGAIMQVNPYSLGYQCVCDIAIKTDPEKEEKVVEFLMNKPYTRAILGPYGRYNMNINTMLPSINELSRVLEELEANTHIKHVDALIWAETINMDHTENLVIKPTEDTKEPKEAYQAATINQNQTKMDETDRKIAEILSNAARTPFRKIAEQLNISTKNVIQRYKRLRGNVLTLSTITVNLEKLGYKATASLFIKAANKSEISRIHSRLLEIPNMIVTIRFIGNYDIRAVVALTDFEDMFRLADQIYKIKGIEQTDMFLNRPFFKWPLNIFASTLNDSTQAVMRHPRFRELQT